MKIEKYVRALLPNFEKRKVLEDLRGLTSELSEITIPAYEKASEVFRNGRFTSKTVQTFDSDCKRRLSHFKHTHVATIHRSLKMAHANAEAVTNLIVKDYASDIMRDGMTYLIANQMQFVEVVTFASEFSRRWLLHLFTLETTRFDDRDYSEKNAILREQKYLDDRKEHFFNALRIVSRNPDQLAQAFDEVPDVVIDPDNAGVAGQVMGSSKLDPLQFGLIPIALNPVYYVRMAFAEWQTNRYHLLREEAKQLELKLLFIKQTRGGTQDAKLEQQIVYSQERLEKLRYKIHRMENRDGEA